MASYAFWQAFGGLGFVLRGQGIQILKACDLVKEGKSAKEIVDVINAEKEKMNLSIKALLPEEEKPAPEINEKKPEEPEEEELREWKDEDVDGGASIADLINN